MKDLVLLLIGSIFGLLFSLTSIVSMEGILFRPNHKGQLVLSLSSIKEYLIAPFLIGTSSFNTIWTIVPNLSWTNRLKLLQTNWIAMLSIGFLASCAIVYTKKLIF